MKVDLSKYAFLSAWRFNSLKVRLMLSALLMIVIVLPIIGITLNHAFEVQIRSAVKNELSAYSYSILAVAEVEDNHLFMPGQLLENQFNVIESGLYALITSKGKTDDILWSSRSLLGIDTPSNLVTPQVGQSQFLESVIEGKAHLIYSFSASFTSNASDGEKSFPLTLHIIKDQADLLQVIEQFKQQLWSWLFILMLLLIFVQIAWLKWTLKPLLTLKSELAMVEQGKAEKLQASYPQELEQVTNQVNVLLKTEQMQRKRYRNALSDLAHSLKTPLAVMQSQNDLSATSSEQITIINHTIEHQLKRAQSAGESSWHLGISMEPIAKKLCNTLGKIYRDKNLTIRETIPQQVIFKGDEADLMEILGNLMDNACKAAKSEVSLKVEENENQLFFSIEDDGQGISDSQKQTILNRGTRADTYQQGHGIGLAIVRDLVASYQGKLSIENSSDLGGAKFVILFNS